MKTARHTGPGNTGVNYEMGGTILSKTVKEKDLGVTMNVNMKVEEEEEEETLFVNGIVTVSAV